MRTRSLYRHRGVSERHGVNVSASGNPGLLAGSVST